MQPVTTISIDATASCGAVLTERLSSLAYCCRRVLIHALTVLATSVSYAQPPGTPPPNGAVTPTAQPAAAGGKETDNALQVEAFLFLDESGNPVLQPGMRWEEYERLMRMRSNADTADLLHSLSSLTVTGTVDGGTASLDVVIEMDVASTDGNWVSFPLRMRSLRPQGDFEISIVSNDVLPEAGKIPSTDASEEADTNAATEPSTQDQANQDEDRENARPPLHQVALAPDGDGYVLLSRTTSPTSLVVRFPAFVRVDSDAGEREIQFSFPETSTSVELLVPQSGILAEVSGRGFELITQTETNGGTKIGIESVGGDFRLWWSPRQSAPTRPSLLNIESDVQVFWDAPQGQPEMIADMTIRNSTGDLRSLAIDLPPGAILMDQQILDAGSADAQLIVPSYGSQKNTIDIEIPADLRVDQLELSIELQLANTGASADSPLPLKLPTVRNAIRNSGTLLIRTSDQYRLRWLRRPWLRNVIARSDLETTFRRSYAFEFDRGSFELPVWLAAKQRRLRLSSELEITLFDEFVGLDMTVRSSGEATDGRGVQIDLGPWTLRGINDLPLGNPIEAERFGTIYEIDLGLADSPTPETFQISAELPITKDTERLEVALPKIIEVEDSVMVEQSLLNLDRRGRKAFVVDLGESTGLDRYVGGAAGAPNGQSQFRIVSTPEASRLVARITQRPQTIGWISDTQITLDGSQLRTQSDWTITSEYDLQGRLPVRIVSTSDPSSTPSTSQKNAADSWRVSVDGDAAVLEKIQGDRYAVVSDRLASGARSIRIEHLQSFDAVSGPNAVDDVPIMIPNTENVVINGRIKVLLRGDQVTDVIVAGTTDQTQIELERIPRRPLQIQRLPRADDIVESSLRRIIIRTITGEAVRHEQVYATVEGGDAMRIRLPRSVELGRATATVDDQSVELKRRGNDLEVRLPGDRVMHSVVVKLWFPMVEPNGFRTIRPMVDIPIGVERAYWKVIVPTDTHLIWASPTLARAMSWQFDGWRLVRKPTESNQVLARLVQTRSFDAPQVGNEYLYVGTNVPSFQAVFVNRSLLWMLVGSVVLAITCLFTYVPVTRNPITAAIIAVAIAGLLLITPDAAILVGQWSLAALVLVAIMMVAQSIVIQRHGARVMIKSRHRTTRRPSTRVLQRATDNRGGAGTIDRDDDGPQSDPANIDAAAADGSADFAQQADAQTDAQRILSGSSLTATQTMRESGQ